MVWSLSQHSCFCGHYTGPPGISPCLYAEHVEVPVHFSCFALMSQRVSSWKSTRGLVNSISNTGIHGLRLEDCDSAIAMAIIFCVKGECTTVHWLGKTQRSMLGPIEQMKCKALHLERNNPVQQYVLGADQLESSCAKKDLGVLLSPSPS